MAKADSRNIIPLCKSRVVTSEWWWESKDRNSGRVPRRRLKYFSALSIEALAPPFNNGWSLSHSVSWCRCNTSCLTFTANPARFSSFRRSLQAFLLRTKRDFCCFCRFSAGPGGIEMVASSFVVTIISTARLSAICGSLVVIKGRIRPLTSTSNLVNVCLRLRR